MLNFVRAVILMILPCIRDIYGSTAREGIDLNPFVESEANTLVVRT